ncbi:hemolysin secretion protein D [Comamonas testosteroni TK102]|uniref:Hemolysin secretion protein D n=1 Tax=Comamonas testosteroni TK102 TaxID=1392005 RepID=A0A076PX69_COMTE|nr:MULTISPECIES: efflux RND transporter periplasmic adaptor subunit [Comamonas]AIJ48405.1 hemolysin secretion protein D [Comamonas testosteroni TK102]MPS90461.1 efflux RND transporter periplasmic adaptor subunit [Comamonas sp.]
MDKHHHNPVLRLSPKATVLVILASCVVLGGGVLLWQGGGKRMPAAAAATQASAAKTRQHLFHPSEKQRAAFTVQQVQSRPFHAEVVTEGKIALDENRLTRIYSPFGGRVTELLVNSGDKVQRGQKLLSVEASDSIETQKDFIAALGDHRKAKSQFELSAAVEARLNALHKDEAASKKDWDEARAALLAAQSDLRSAEIALQAVRSRLKLLGKTPAEIQKFENSGVISSDAPVYSPIAGVVLQRNVGPGQFVDGGSGDGEAPLLIGDISKIWLLAFVRESDAAAVRLQQPVDFTVLTLPGQTFNAKVSYVGSALDGDSRRLLVRAVVDNRDGLLKPEMFAQVRILTGETAPSLAVPREAVIHEGDATRVWIMNADGSAELRSFKAGLVNGDWMQVLDGLQPDNQVITAGSLFIDRAAALASARDNK